MNPTPVWLEIARILIPALIGAGLALTLNDRLKRSELLYKERLGNFKEVSKVLSDTQKYCHILHSSIYAARHSVVPQAAAEKLQQIERYIDFDYEPKLYFFSIKVRNEFVKLRHG